TMASPKPFQALIIDTGPLIKNTVAISTLLQQAEELYTTSAIISEIRDATTRSRVETTLLPFLKIRNPNPVSYEVVTQLSKRTGDFPVLSRQDLGILALAYEVECEKTGGKSVRTMPGQKETHLSGNPKENRQSKGKSRRSRKHGADKLQEPNDAATQDVKPAAQKMDSVDQKQEAVTRAAPAPKPAETETLPPPVPKQEHNHNLSKAQDPSSSEDETLEFSDESDGDWITPTNITQHIAKDTGLFTPNRKSNAKLNPKSKPTTPSTSTCTPTPSEPTQTAVATITTDFAMQNVLLQMNLHLLSSSLSRIHTLRTHILRCHACFFTTKLMDKQFCPRCGQPTLQRIGCSTLASGEFKLHLSSKFTWNTRGNRYSIPKPVAGSANGRVTGGGKGNWGNELILAEDQKEYVRGVEEGKRVKARDLMDEDYLPGILTGERGREGGRMKVGAGRNVNSKKRV
ncbi:Nin one binding Zn-ribbon like-domain-containing protein, partial [Clohesyomyces aquaticus]